MTIFHLARNVSSISDKVSLFLATGFGSGYAPKAPGTAGTVVAILPYYFLQQYSLIIYLSVVLITILLGVYLCHNADKQLGGHDSKQIVWDEFCGFWITMIAIPFSWLNVLLGFVLFRYFDIHKPWPIRVVDQKLSGGLGVMADDILAGLAALACMHLIIALI